MKITLRVILSFLLSLAIVNTYAQQSALSTGKAPFNKASSHVTYGTFPLADIAYANDNSTSNNISMPLPAGNPFTVIGSFTAPNFASSMVKGGDGNYYLIDIAPALYLFDPGSGTCTLIGNITGMGSDQPNGISYNTVNNKYYMVSSSALYSLDIYTLQSTLIGSFSPAISGLMIDLCFDYIGKCYSYEINITPGAANAYLIDITNAHLTTLGYLGYTPNYGQGMSFDNETGTIYLSAFNYDTFTGQLRTMDKNTGMTTLVYNWGDQIAPFSVNTACCGPCPVGAASNPDPPNGSIDISITGTTLTWDNSEGTTNVEVWFGTGGNVVKVYDDTLITSWETGVLQYFTPYHWFIRDKTDTCYSQSPTWSFTTEQDTNLLILDFYPQFAQYWTGKTEGTEKTDGQIFIGYPYVAWAVFDISSISPGTIIQNIDFNGWIYNNGWPHWSATPMGNINPVTDSAENIFDQVVSAYDSSVAYIYRDETGTVINGWHQYNLSNSAISDIEGAINSGQGWFAIGFVDRHFNYGYFLTFDGWSDLCPPYLTITFGIPVELKSFRADVQDGEVVLSWTTATETNNKGFDVERNGVSLIGNWEKIGFVSGSGTTTEPKSYTFTDNNVTTGNYLYRLKQIDLDGSFKYSNVVEVTVNVPIKYSLEQNYPNPFNPATVIEYHLPNASHVLLKVFDVLGREVKTLVDENKSAGKYKVSFNPGRLSNGVYYYRLSAGSFVQTKKMILIK